MKQYVNVLKGFVVIIMMFCLFVSGQHAVYAELPTLTWKLSHTTAPDSPYNFGAMKFAEVVKEKSGGKFTIDIHHSGVLGWEREVLEAMQMGTIEITIPSLGPFAVFVPSFDVFNLPFMFKSVEHLQKAYKSPSVEKLKKDAEQYGFIVLEVGVPTFRYPLNSKKPIEKLEDFKGTKFRTMGTPAHIDAYKAMGANVTTTSFSELYSALQLGVVDGCENFYANLYTMKFHEVTKYLSDLPALNNAAALVVSKVKWDELPTEYQDILREAAAAGMAEMDAKALSMEEDARQKMVDAGIEFTHIEDITPFIEATQEVREKYLNEMEPWVREIAEEIMTME